MKRNRWLALIGLAALAITSASAQNDWDFDDIYNNQQQVQEQRKKTTAREKAERERLAAERRQREEEWARANQENSRYVYDQDEIKYEDEYYDDLSDQDIDAYNRRGNAKDSLRTRSYKRKGNTSKQYASREGNGMRSRPRSSRGYYADRIARFHDPATIVVQRGNGVVIYTDEDYYGYADAYDQGYYGGGDVNIYIGGGYGSYGYGYGAGYYGGYPNYYSSYYSGYYPWYSPWYSDPYWSSIWYGPRYRHYWSAGWWGYSSWGWGWGSAWDYYNSPYYSWHDGYRQGFIDGYYNGYYGNGYGYDPYVGSYYHSANRTPNGRRNSEYYGGANNRSRNNGSVAGSTSSVNQQISDREARRREAVNDVRGNYWRENSNRTIDNSTFNPREYRPSRVGNARGSYNSNSRGTNSRISSEGTIQRRNEYFNERPVRRGSYDSSGQRGVDRSQQRIEQRELPSRSQRSQMDMSQPQRRGSYSVPSEPRRSNSSSQQSMPQRRSYESSSSSQSSGSSSPSRGSYGGGSSSSSSSRGRR